MGEPTVPVTAPDPGNSAAPGASDYPDPRRAALYSLLLGPGVGQFYTGRHLRGAIFFSTFVYSFGSLLYLVLKVYGEFAARINAGDQAALFAFIDRARALNAGQFANAFLVIWILSTVDAYVTAKAIRRARNHA